MGNLFVVVPLDAQVAVLLDAETFARPTTPPYGSMPTPRQILAVVDRLAGFDVEVQRDPEGQRIGVLVNQRGGPAGVWLHLKRCAGDEAPCELSFERSSHEVIDAILRPLAEACGPFVLRPDCDDPMIYTREIGVEHRDAADPGRVVDRQSEHAWGRVR